MRLSLLMCAVLASLARAQEPADAGAELIELSPPVVEIAPAVPPLPSTPAAAIGPPTARERLVGAWGFGFLGTAPVLRAEPGTDSQGQRIDYASVPLLGLRWWSPWKSRLGLEVGLGAMVSSARASDGGGNGSGFQAGPSSVELLLHLSLPVVLASTTNTILFVAPEVRGAFSLFDGDSSGVGVVTATTWNFGLRAGLEIFFTFIGLPNLSLEAGVRAGLTHEGRYFVTSSALSSSTVSVEQTRFQTSLVANPWDLFTSSIAARYYF